VTASSTRRRYANTLRMRTTKTCRRACTNTSGAQFGSERKFHDLAADPFRRAAQRTKGVRQEHSPGCRRLALTGSINKFFSEERPRWGLEQLIWWVGPGKADAHYVAVERNCEPNMAAAKAFYMTIALAVALGIAMNFAAINPIRALYWCAVLNGIVSVPVMAMMMLISSNGHIMCRDRLG
jgi:hypothetical protein